MIGKKIVFGQVDFIFFFNFFSSMVALFIVFSYLNPGLGTGAFVHRRGFYCEIECGRIWK